MTTNPREITITGIGDLADTASSLARENGWHDNAPDISGDEGTTPAPYSQHVDWILSKLMLAVTEISEAVDELRNPENTPDRVYTSGNGKPEGFPVEIADTFIRLADLYGTLENMGWAMPDLDQIIESKLQHNASRGARHGGKVA